MAEDAPTSNGLYAGLMYLALKRFHQRVFVANQEFRIQRDPFVTDCVSVLWNSFVEFDQMMEVKRLTGNGVDDRTLVEWCKTSKAVIRSVIVEFVGELRSTSDTLNRVIAPGRDRRPFYERFNQEIDRINDALDYVDAVKLKLETRYQGMHLLKTNRRRQT